MEQAGPLEALHDVEVDDVDAILAVEGLEDGLIGGEVGELDEGGDGVVGLEGGEDSLGLDERVGFGG